MSRGAFVASAQEIPLVRLSASERDEVSQSLLPSWRTWCSDWGLSRPQVRVEPLVQGAARVCPSEGWRVTGHLGGAVGTAQSGGRRAAVRESGTEAMTRAAMGVPVQASWAPASLAAELAQAVETSWRVWRNGWLGPVSAAQTDDPLQQSSALATAGASSLASDLGDVVLTFSCVRPSTDGDASVVERSVCIPATLLTPLLGSPRHAARAAGTRAKTAAPTPLSLAIAHLPVRIRIRLGQAVLQMGELVTLQPGDVIALDHALGRPAQVELDESSGQPLAATARLGRAGAYWSVRLHPGQTVSP